LQIENKKEDILSIKSKILIIGTNLDNQPKKREREREQREYSGE